MKRLTIVILSIFTLTSCEKDEAGLSGFLLPNSFSLKGSASGMVDGLQIKCICDLVVEIDEVTQSDAVKIYRGTHGGHFGRTILQSDGSGISLVPDVFGELIIYQYDDKNLIFSIPVNKGTGVPFYELLSTMEGCIDNDVVNGTWLCGPFNTREDSIGIIDATWIMDRN